MVKKKNSGCFQSLSVGVVCYTAIVRGTHASISCNAYGNHYCFQIRKPGQETLNNLPGTAQLITGAITQIFLSKQSLFLLLSHTVLEDENKSGFKKLQNAKDALGCLPHAFVWTRLVQRLLIMKTNTSPHGSRARLQYLLLWIQPQKGLREAFVCDLYFPGLHGGQEAAGESNRFIVTRWDGTLEQGWDSPSLPSHRRTSPLS